MISYKLQKNSFGEIYSVRRFDGCQIPFDPANTDYQTYLKWLEEGGVPEAADNVPTE